MAAKAKPRGGVLPSPVLLMQQALNIWLYQHVLPPPLEASPPPSHHLGSSRTEKVHSTELMHILSVST
jgi:hypothetical protein